MLFNINDLLIRLTTFGTFSAGEGFKTNVSTARWCWAIEFSPNPHKRTYPPQGGAERTNLVQGKGYVRENREVSLTRVFGHFLRVQKATPPEG